MTYEVISMTKKGLSTKAGEKICAFFDFSTETLKFKGAALVLSSDGRWAIWPPKLSDEHVRASMVGIQFVGTTIPEGVLGPAVAAYRALGGREGPAVV